MLGNLFSHKSTMVDREQALPGRATPMPLAERNTVLGNPMAPPQGGWESLGLEQAVLGFGCFWGAEKAFWEAPGVYTTAVGYAGGFTDNPTYEEVCSGRTGHAEVVLVVFDPAKTSYGEILRVFWEHHDPTQGMRQGNDVGSQYRSVILYDTDQHRQLAEASLTAYQAELKAAGYGEITTEIAPLERFYYAEDYHQQYLQKNPFGYCPAHGTGVSCPIGLNVPTSAAEAMSRAVTTEPAQA
jgi:peptide-methionine (S)-S-oxide reductase